MTATEDPATNLLRHRPFVLFWCARMAATIGLQMQAVAVGWQIYELTGSAFDLGLVGFVQFVPVFALMLVAGHFADRYDRRKVVALANTCEGGAAAVLAIGTFGGWLTPGLIFAMVFVLGAARAFEHPSMQSLLPRIVAPQVLPRAVAAASSAGQMAVIAGPALGGVLYVVAPTLVYGLCAALFATAGMLAVTIRIATAPSEREPLNFTTLFGGIAFIRRNPIVLGAISLDLFAVLLGGATALLPIFARDIFAAGPGALGALRAAPALGALAMALALAQWPLRRRVGRIMLLSVAVYGVATIVFALSTSIARALIALAVIGASDMVSVVIRQTVVQLRTPDAMRGRVYAVNSLFIGTSNQLGEFESGVTAHWFGTVPSVVIGGLGTLLIVAIWVRVFPDLARYDNFETTKP
jgi:MFS family permease